MRLKVAFPLAAAVFALAAWTNPASAAHCGACDYPAPCCEPEQCCMPVVRYRVCYRTVEEEQPCVCYRQVFHTVMKECRSVCYKTVYEQHVRQEHYTVCKPVYEDYNVARKYTVCHTEYEQHMAQRRYTTCKPVYSEYQVPVQLLHLSAGLRTARRPALLHNLQAGLLGVSSAGQLLHLPAGLRTARRPTLLHRLPSGLSGLPGAGSTTARASRSTSSTSLNAATRPASRSIRNTSAGSLLHVEAGLRTAHLPGSADLLSHRARAAHLLLQDLHLRAGLHGEVRQGLHGLLSDGVELLPRPDCSQVLPDAGLLARSTLAPARRTTAPARP